MIGDVENFVDSTKNLLESKRDFGEVAGYKMDIEQATVFLYTSNK